jgi:hypothetical protein
VLLPSTVHSSAQSSGRPFFSGGIGPSTGQIVGAIVGIASVGAAMGIGVYYAVHHGHSLLVEKVSKDYGPCEIPSAVR